LKQQLQREQLLQEAQRKEAERKALEKQKRDEESKVPLQSIGVDVPPQILQVRVLEFDSWAFDKLSIILRSERN
jgi:hypothetical protein